jgi:hypothetical protein
MPASPCAMTGARSVTRTHGAAPNDGAQDARRALERADGLDRRDRAAQDVHAPEQARADLEARGRDDDRT